MYKISHITLAVMATQLSIIVGSCMGEDFFLILHTFDRGTHHTDDKTEIVLLTEESLPLTINR